jgi:hypothetical protein
MYPPDPRRGDGPEIAPGADAPADLNSTARLSHGHPVGQCQATDDNGWPCKRSATVGTDWCPHHEPGAS